MGDIVACGEGPKKSLRGKMEKSPESSRRHKAMETRIAQRTVEVLDNVRQRLLDAGLDPVKVDCACQGKAMGLAKDIVFRGE
ncbi:hypothetical protein DFAR_910016 [Desulfarculales bacterium]